MAEKTQLIHVMAESQLMNQSTFWNILRTTIFPREMTDDQGMVFLAVSNKLGLDPINGEIYAMVKAGKVMPMVGVDGWMKRANRHQQFDGMEIEMAEDFTACTVKVHRKDRSYPVTATEYLSECKKSTGPWSSHPRRMLRHRAIIQSIRLAFGSGGAVDEDDRHYFDADAEIISTPKSDTGSRTEDLKAVLESQAQPQDSEDEDEFATRAGITCNTDGCRKRLVRRCGKCDEFACQDHWSESGDSCNICVAVQDEQDAPGKPEPEAETDTVDDLVDGTQDNELPWE